MNTTTHFVTKFCLKLLLNILLIQSDIVDRFTQTYIYCVNEELT